MYFSLSCTYSASNHLPCLHVLFMTSNPGKCASGSVKDFRRHGSVEYQRTWKKSVNTSHKARVKSIASGLFGAGQLSKHLGTDDYQDHDDDFPYTEVDPKRSRNKLFPVSSVAPYTAL